MSGYWPWWAGALALGSIAVAHARLTARPMGVSGSFAKLAHLGDELAREKVDRRMLADTKAFEAALMAATAAEFGAEPADEPAANPTEAPRESLQPPANRVETPVAGHVAFLAMMAVGALLAAAARGGAHVASSLGPVHERFFGSGAAMLATLAAGGVLVGVGTRMSGGCTSGHGLSGCARFVPASLLGTATFMATAIGTSFLLSWVNR